MNSINSANFIGMLTVFCTWLYELITLMYLTSLVYYIYQRFRKLSLLGKLWIVVIFCLVLNVGTFLCLLHGLSRIDRLYSFFSIAHDTNPSSPEGNNNTSPSWVVVPLSFMVRHSDEEILAVIDESLHLSQSDLQRRRDPPSEDKLRQLERLWAMITFVDHCRPESNNIDSNNIESNNIDSNNVDSNNIDSNNIDSNNVDSNNIDSNNIDSNNVDSNNIDSNNVDSNNIDSNNVDSNNIDSTIENNEEECMICLQPHSVTVAPIEGSTYLMCSCSCRFHKKCILEWFYFVEKRSQEEENVMIVTCPNCRHVFSRGVVVSATSTSEEEGIST